MVVTTLLVRRFSPYDFDSSIVNSNNAIDIFSLLVITSSIVIRHKDNNFFLK
jgi:hypothetical protein